MQNVSDSNYNRILMSETLNNNKTHLAARYDGAFPFPSLSSLKFVGNILYWHYAYSLILPLTSGLNNRIWIGSEKFRTEYCACLSWTTCFYYVLHDKNWFECFLITNCCTAFRLLCNYKVCWVILIFFNDYFIIIEFTNFTSFLSIFKFLDQLKIVTITFQITHIINFHFEEIFRFRLRKLLVVPLRQELVLRFRTGFKAIWKVA